MSNEKVVVWTISYGDHCIVLSTRRKVDIDEADRKVEIPSVALILAMKRLSKKYCNKGFAVLFDME